MAAINLASNLATPKDYLSDEVVVTSQAMLKDDQVDSLPEQLLKTENFLQKSLQLITEGLSLEKVKDIPRVTRAENLSE